jgi:ethanolamine phosphate transferase 2 subunit G
MKYSTNNFYPNLVYFVVVLLICYFFFDPDRRIIQLAFYILLLLIHKKYNSLLIVLIILQAKFSNTINNTIVHYWMSQVAFCAFGNSISISSIDFSGAYTGQTDFNVVSVGTLMVVLVYSGPLIFLLEKNVNIHAFIQIRFTLKAMSISIFNIILFFMRNHLFIWSVFSPKFLYEIAGSIFIFVSNLIIWFISSYGNKKSL